MLNIEFARAFTPMSAEEMAQVATRLRPVYDSGRLAWMQPGYTDGIPA